jgi:hypothetical protein
VDSPYADTVYNSFYDPIADGNTLIYYNTTTRLAPSVHGNNRVVMLKNPKYGVSILELDPAVDYTVFRHNIITGASTSHMVEHANPHAALPIGLGRLRGDSSVALKLSKLTLEDAHELHRTYEWQGRKVQVKMSGPSDVAVQLDKRLYVYRPLTPDLKSLVTFVLGANTQVTNLKPVKVILPACL